MSAIITFLLTFAITVLADFNYAIEEVNKINLEESKTYTETQVLDYQESVVDEMYKKIIEDKSYKIKKDSKDFKAYIKAIGFLSKQSKDHNAASYLVEIKEKMGISTKEMWSIVSKNLPLKIVTKLKEDYKIEIKEPKG